MAATRRAVSFLRPSSNMKPPQLILAAIALSSSCSNVLLAESFSIGSQLNQRTPCSWQHQHRRCVHLPPRHSSLSDDAMDEGSSRQSVTGPIYEMDDVPTVKLFTKQGCTLCDKVKDVLESLREENPHSLYAVDITDDDKEEWFSKYKYDIPVLHINDIYWTKHRLTAEDAIAGIVEASAGDFEARQGEPDAGRLENN